jgi:NAD(P)-dependent dehydrogenase (short-subunit alcohol dehydrogenase family)
VLCASQIGSPGGLFTSNLNEWLELYKTNVLGNLCVLKQVISALSPEAFLRVVFFAGGGAAYGYPDFSGYALTKAATVRAVENVAMEFNEKKLNASIVALAPGAVATDMLAKVIANGGMVKTKTDISEPVEFVRKFVFDEIPIPNTDDAADVRGVILGIMPCGMMLVIDASLSEITCRFLNISVRSSKMIVITDSPGID